MTDSLIMPNGKTYSKLGFGCSSLWAKPSFPKRQAEELFRMAVNEGITHFDTGPSYGNGEGERRLGDFLAASERSRMLLSTKVGSHIDVNGKVSKSFAIDSLEQSLTDSLKRLRLETIDILYLHGPKVNDLNEDVFEFFEREKKRGRIVYSGANSFDENMIRDFHNSPIDVIMLQYNIIDRSAEKYLDLLKKNEKIVISATALGQAAFNKSAIGNTVGQKLWYYLRLAKNDPLFWSRSYNFKGFAESNGINMIEAALSFVLGDSRVDGALFGTSSLAHMFNNIEIARKSSHMALRKKLLQLPG